MEFKKCSRCGNFFTSQSSICCNCEPKNKFDMANSSSFIAGNPEIHSMPNFSGIINNAPNF